MSNLSLKQKLMIIAALIGAALILIFQRGLYSPELPQPLVKSASEQAAQSEKVEIISTIPTPLNETIIVPTQSIEITFNYALENKDEFKYSLEPETEAEIKLSDDRKTAKIIPSKPFNLGTTFTLNIIDGANGTKFDGSKRLSESYTYHFKTIEYRGI